MYGQRKLSVYLPIFMADLIAPSLMQRYLTRACVELRKLAILNWWCGWLANERARRAANALFIFAKW